MKARADKILTIEFYYPPRIPIFVSTISYASDHFDRFDWVFRSVIVVPKEEIDRREKEWKRTRKKAKKSA